MVSLALHEPYVHAGHIQNLSGPHVACGPQVPHPWCKCSSAYELMIQTGDTLVIRLGLSWLMVAEICSGNWIKDATVCSSKCRFGSFF